MTLLLPGNTVDDHNIQQKFDTISLAWPNRNVGVFSVYRQAALAIPQNTAIIFDTKQYDVSGWYDTTNGRYTPQVAGYYRLNAAAAAAQAPANTIYIILFKNGGVIKRSVFSLGNGFANAHTALTANVVANGTTDYFQIFFYHDVGGNLALVPGIDNVWFDGELIAP